MQYTTVLKSVTLEAGKSYYIIVSSYDEGSGIPPCFQFTFNIDPAATACKTPTTGDDCPQAHTFTTLPFSDKNQTTCGHPNNFNRGTQSCYNYYPYDYDYTDGTDYVYKFVPDKNYCGQITIKPYRSYTSAVLFENCPTSAGATCLYSDYYYGYGTIDIPYTFEQGKEYYIVVTGDSAYTGSNCRNFDLDIVAYSDIGKNCSVPLVVPSLPFSDSNTTLCKDNDFNNGGYTCTYQYTDGNEIIYTYNSPGNECISIDLSNVTEYSIVHIWDRCPELPGAVCLATDYGYNSISLTHTTTAPTTLYIAVSCYYSFYNSNFDIRIRKNTDIGKDCNNPMVINSSTYKDDNGTACKMNLYNDPGNCLNNTFYYKYIGGNDIVYTYNAQAFECINLKLYNVTADGGIIIYDRCPTDPGARCLATSLLSPYTDTTKLQYTTSMAQTLYIVIGAEHYYFSSSSNENISFTLDFVASIITDPVGIACNVAIPITAIPFNAVNQETRCKGPDYARSQLACKANYLGDDIVYKYVPTKDECVRIYGTKANNPGAVFVSDKCPDEPGVNCVASGYFDNGQIDSAILDIRLIAGQEYYITVASEVADMVFDIRIESVSYSEDDNNCIVCSNDICKTCQNAGLELQNLSGWLGAYGTYGTPDLTPGFSQGPNNDPNSRHTVMTSQGIDPIIPELKTVGPFSGKSALRLGNYITGAEAEQISYTFTPTANNKNFFYYYAVVLDDIGHEAYDQPFFSIHMYDASGAEILCGAYQVSASAGIPGFQDKPLSTGSIARWKDWSPVAVPLDNYIDQPITIIFTTKDCNQGGHFGYAYVDTYCGQLQLKQDKKVICPNESVTFSAPEGFKSYNWHAQGSITPLGTNSSFTTTTAGDYEVTLTTVSDCSVSVPFSVKGALNPVAQFSFQQLCSDSLVQFTDASTKAAGDTASVVAWEYTFSAGISPENTKNLTHKFPGPGTYSVKLKATNSLQCSNEITKSVTVDDLVTASELISVDSIIVCDQQDVQFTATTINGAVYTWNKPDNSFYTNQQNPKLLKPSPAQSGYYKVSTPLPNCPVAKDSVYLKVNAYPNLIPPPDTTVCDGNSGIPLLAKATGGDPLHFQWYTSSTGGSPVATAANYRTPAIHDTTTYYVAADIAGCAVARKAVTVNVNPIPAIPVANNSTICAGIDTTITAALNPGTVQWYDNSSMTHLVNTGSSYALSGLSTSSTYYLRGALNGCYSAQKPIIVTVNPAPATPSIPDNSICAGNAATIIAGNVDGITKWYSAAGSSTVLSSSPQFKTPTLYTTTSYLVRNTKNGCNSPFSTATVTVKDLPNPPVLNTASTCTGGDTLLSASGTTGTINWYDAPLNGNLVYTGSDFRTPILTNNISYYVDATLDGCVSPRRESRVTVYPYPEMPRPYYDKPICEGSTLPLRITVAQPGTYEWTGPNGFTSTERAPYLNNIGPNNVGQYSVRVIANGCPSPINYLNVEILPKETASFTYSAATYCLTGGNTRPSFTGTTGGIYSSTDGIILDPITGEIDLSQSNPGHYTINYISPGVCYAAYSRDVVLSAPLKADFSFEGPYCNNSDEELMPNTDIETTKGRFTASPSGLDIDPITGLIKIASSKAKTYTIYNTVAAQNNCPAIQAQDQITIYAQPATPQLSSNSPICEGDTLKFSLSSADLAIGSIQWTGPGNFKSNSQNPSLFNAGMSNNGGVFQASITVNNCTSTLGSTTVAIDPVPVTQFNTRTEQPEVPIYRNTLIHFENASSNASSYEWDFGDNSTKATGVNTEHRYSEPGVYTITLKASNSIGCSNTSTQKVEVIDDFQPYVNIPEAFSPNNDGKNDVFHLDTRYLQQFKLSIFNRWGEIIFESSDAQQDWDGKFKDEYVPTGAYVFIAKAKDLKGKDYARIGTVIVTH